MTNDQIKLIYYPTPKKWRESQWRFYAKSWSSAFSIITKQKPRMSYIGQSSLPKSWSDSARYWSAKRDWSNHDDR